MKRFTETQKWADPWFRKLSPVAKLLWGWLTDNCDAAGVISADLELASFQIGDEVGQETIAELGDRVKTLDSGKFFIPRFIEFQVGTPSPDCKAHKPIFQSIQKHKIESHLEGIPKGIEYDQDKEKDKDKEKDGDESGGRRGAAPCTLDQAKAAAVGAGITAEDAEHWWNSRASDGWMKGGDGNRRPVGNWQFDMKAFATAVRRGGVSQRASPVQKPQAAYTDKIQEL